MTTAQKEKTPEGRKLKKTVNRIVEEKISQKEEMGNKTWAGINK